MNTAIQPKWRHPSWLLLSASGVLVLDQLLVDQWLIALVVVGLGSLVVALRAGQPTISTLALLASTWAAWKLFLPRFQQWPWIMGVPVVCVVVALLLWPKRFAAAVPFGRIDRSDVALSGFIVLSACLGLWLWLEFAAPDLAVQRSLLPGAGLAVKLGILLGFALINAALEEFIYRSVVLQALSQVFSPQVAVVGQAIVFASAHATASVPDGPAGVILTFIFGVLQGLLRHRVGGLGLPFIVHVLVDVFIGCILFFGRA